jgi:hypothetical protein
MLQGRLDVNSDTAANTVCAGLLNVLGNLSAGASTSMSGIADDLTI